MAYTYQAPKDFDAQSAGFKKKFKDIGDLYATGRYIAQPKYDGTFSAVYTDSGAAMSRQGELQPAAKLLVEKLTKLLGRDKLVFVELWTPGMAHKDMNGLARRQVPQPELHCRVFDCITLAEFHAGKSSRPYFERYNQFLPLMGEYLEIEEAAKGDMSYKGLPSKLDIVNEAVKLKGSKVGAFDGLILRDLDGIWLPGAVKNGEVLRVKPAITLDVMCVDQQAEVKPTKLGGTVTIELRGVRTEVGSGLNQKDLQGILDGNLDFRGKVLEVECLGVNESGKLREPRLKSVRTDTPREEDK